MQWQCWMSILHGLTSWNSLSKGHIQATAVVPNWGVCNRLDLTYFFTPESSKSVSFLRKLEFYSSFTLKSSTALYTATNFMMKRPGIIRAFSLNHFYRFEFTLPLRSKSVTGISTLLFLVYLVLRRLCLLQLLVAVVAAALVPLFPRKQEVWQQSCRASTFGQIQSRCVSWD